MKKTSRIKRISIIILMLFAFGALIVSYVALKKKCEDLIKQKVWADEELKDQSIKTNNLTARYQNLTSEDRIVSIAAYELGMIISDPPIMVLTIDKEKISELQTLVQEQYD